MSGVITENRVEELKTIQEQLRELDGSIQDILDGKSSMKQFADKYGLSPQKLNSAMNLGSAGLLRRLKIVNNDNIFQMLVASLSPSERLIRSIFNLTYEVVLLDIAEEEAVLEILEKSLNEKQYGVIKLRFGFEDGKPKTLEETSKVFDLTTARIRQIESNALRKLRTPRNLRLLLPNYSLRVETLQEQQQLQIINKRLTEAEEKVKSKNIEDILNAKLDELELSVRSYNCLKRAGINTIGDLSKRSVYDMMKVRNLGRKSLEEVISKLKDVGIELSDDNYEETKIDKDPKPESISEFNINPFIRTKLITNDITTLDALFNHTILDLSKFMSDRELQLIIKNLESQFNRKFVDDNDYWLKHKYECDNGNYLQFNKGTPILYKRDYMLGTSISKLDLPLPIYVALVNSDVNTIKDLTFKGPEISKLTKLEMDDIIIIRNAALKRYGVPMDIR